MLLICIRLVYIQAGFRLRRLKSKYLVDSPITVPAIVKGLRAFTAENQSLPALGRDIPSALPALAKWNEILLKQIVAEAETLFASNPKDLAPGNLVVLRQLITGAESYNINELNKLAKSEGWVPFFLTPCEPGAGEDFMRIASEVLADRASQPGHQLYRSISTSEMIEKFVNLLAFYSTRESPQDSLSVLTFQQLVSPTTAEDAGEVILSDEELERAKTTFCGMFDQAIKARCQAAQALAPASSSDKDEEGVFREPSEEGLANMKNVSLLKVLIECQYITTALLPDGLFDYQKYLLSSHSALTRRAGLEFLDTLCHSPYSIEGSKNHSDITDAFKSTVVHMLDDSRALIRVLALKWLGNIIDHPVRYKPGFDFVMASVSEEKLVAALKGAEQAVAAAAKVIGSMAKYSTGWEVKDRLRKNEVLVELLWNGTFWDSEKASPDEDEDISEGAWTCVSDVGLWSGEALNWILDPIVDHASIASHILPRLEQLKSKEPIEFADSLKWLPAIASLVIFTPETGVLSRLSEMMANEEQLSDAMQSLNFLSQGSMLTKVTLGQSDHIYPSLVKVLNEGTGDSKYAVLVVLQELLNTSTVSRTRFMNEGGIKALLDIIQSAVPSDNPNLSHWAASALVSFLSDFPEGTQPMIDAGVITILQSKKDSEDISDDVGSVLNLLEEYRTAPAVERFEFTTAPYAAFGKEIPDAAALERLKKNLESSQDEKQLAIVGGLPVVLTDLVRSSSEPKPLLQVLQTLFVVKDLPWDGHMVALRAAERCGLWEALKRFVESDDKEVSGLAAGIQRAIVPGRNGEL
ncbi:hypothetical protein BDV93DRAFT_550669 [Ceratobasidium sp. AG-I]|nr:hypothetical protein BDV93DRAFT_550669 [Ceratobasidium sp. AG-I]